MTRVKVGIQCNLANVYSPSVKQLILEYFFLSLYVTGTHMYKSIITLIYDRCYALSINVQ